MAYLAETEFLFSLRPRDRWNKLAQKILQRVDGHDIHISLLESALHEMRAVLYSQGKSVRETYVSLIYFKRKLIQHSIPEESTIIDDYILADKLREEYAELTYFDSLHAAAALTRNQTLITNDRTYDRADVKTITFKQLAR